MPEGLAVMPLGLAVWSLDLLESELFGVPEGFAVEPLGLAVLPLGIAAASATLREQDLTRVPRLCLLRVAACRHPGHRLCDHPRNPRAPFRSAHGTLG